MPAATRPAPSTELLARAARIRLACFDVDGTLTDGRLYIASDGTETKAFHVHDGLGLSLLKRAGIAVSVIPLHAELTTVQAAELLNVSRPYLIKQIEAGEIPHHMVGTHRRLKLVDVLLYREIDQARRLDAVKALAAEAQELGIY